MNRRVRWLSLRFLACSLIAIPGVSGADKWTEFNIGPFYVDTDADQNAARNVLGQLEQARWVMGGLLEIKELNTTWPVRVLVTRSVKPSSRFALHDGYYLLTINPGDGAPLDQVAHLFLEANTPRLPAGAERGLEQLFGTLRASGSHVTWGGTPAHADLDYARMQLLATKFEYGASFHVFISSLKSGSTLKAAERNALGRDPDAIEREAGARLAAHDWQAVSVSGRPLDPKRDFGDHSLDGAVARAYAASALIEDDPNAAESQLKSCLNEGGAATVLALDSLADVAHVKGEKPDQYWNDAMQAGSKNAAVYVNAAFTMAPDHALPILKKAALLNPLWAEPIYQRAMATEDLQQRETLLKQAIKMNARSTEYWIALARTQTADGHAEAAQSTWLRAEDSAPTEDKKTAVQRLHESLENERLDAVAADRKHERDERVLADQRAQQAESDRIHAAEAQANKASTEAAGKPGTSSDVVDWNSFTKTEKTYGTVTMVDCRSDYVRVAIRDLRGRTRELLYLEPDRKTFSCENKAEKRQIVVTYHPHPDDVHGTDGDIVSVAWR